MSITVQNITKQYGAQKALDDVSFEVRKGEIVGFLGPNGAGKSTLMKILTTYLDADTGTASVNGFDVVSEARNAQRSVGYLPEHNPLYTELYIREYLAFNADVYGVPKSRIEEVIALTGLTPERHKKIGQLSKGYRQRVGLANALLHDPEVLILDEPTTGLDPNQLVEIRNVIRNAGKNKTVFLSTHIMQEVEAICDRILIIDKGRIVKDIQLDQKEPQPEQYITVEFDQPVAEEALATLPHLTSYRSEGGHQWELVFSTEDDMRTAVFDFAASHGVRTLQLSRKERDLETVFREATKEK